MRPSAWFFCVSLAAPVVAIGSSAYAQHAPASSTTTARTQARTRFREGVAAYQANDFQTALAAFQDAYRIAPHPSVRVNIANCYMQLHQPVEALTHFEQFLVESPTVPAAQRTEIQGQIDSLRGQIAEVRVRIGPESVLSPIVSVDGQATAINNVVRMTPGHHIIEVSADGYQMERSEIDATPGMRSEVALRLRRPQTGVVAASSSTTTTTTTTSTTAANPATTDTASASTSTPAASTPASTELATSPTASTETTAPATTPAASSAATVDTGESHGLSPTIFYAGVGVTAVALVGWGVFGGLALTSNSAFEQSVTRINSGEGDYATERANGENAAASARTFALVSDIALGVTVAAAVVSVILYTKADFGSRHVTVSPVVGNQGAGLVFGGRF